MNGNNEIESRIENILHSRPVSMLLDRRAYYCVIVLVRHVDDPQPIIVDGSWYGEIIDQPRGEGGFGYDPYFFVPEFGKTSVELSAEQKNLISHRGKALAQLVEILRAGKF